jgi:hypothetical protein
MPACYMRREGPSGAEQTLVFTQRFPCVLVLNSQFALCITARLVTRSSAHTIIGPYLCTCLWEFYICAGNISVWFCILFMQ